MALPTPPSYQDRIPNDPFFTPISNTLVGDKGELIVGNGLYVDLGSGTLTVSGAVSPGAVEQIVPGLGIQVSNGGQGVTTVTSTGVVSLIAGVGINIVNNGNGSFEVQNVYPPPTSPGVTSITAGPGLLGGTITSSGIISLPATGVSPSTYTNPTITVDAFGRITAITPNQTVKNIVGTAPITVAGGNTNVSTIGILSASTAQEGAVRLENDPTSTSLSTAPTSLALKTVRDIAVSAQVNASSLMPLSGGTFTGPVVFVAGQTFPDTLSTSVATTPGGMFYAQSANNIVELIPGLPGEMLIMSAGAPVWTDEVNGGTF